MIYKYNDLFKNRDLENKRPARKTFIIVNNTHLIRGSHRYQLPLPLNEAHLPAYHKIRERPIGEKYFNQL